MNEWTRVINAGGWNYEQKVFPVIFLGGPERERECVYPTERTIKGLSIITDQIITDQKQVNLTSSRLMLLTDSKFWTRL